MTANNVTLPIDRLDVANDALLEISEICLHLRGFIAKDDCCGTVSAVSKGLLTRIKKLSEAVTDCLGHDRYTTFCDLGVVREEIELGEDRPHD